jgi:DNA-binding transcriptional LysR family regulator
MEPTIRNLDIDLLRTLITIADTGSFSEAAARLGRTQSAVSLQVKRLEEAVGDALLLRSHGRVSGPTAEGLLLIDYARRILRLNDEAYSCFARPEFSGRLRVGLPEEVMEVAFSKVQADFSAACPRVELSVRCDLSVRLVELVETGELDLALARRVSVVGAADIPHGWRVIRREQLVWATGEGSIAIDQSPLPVGIFHEGCVLRTAALAVLAAAHIPWRPAFVGSSFSALRHAVVSGIAVTPLPKSVLLPGMVEVRGLLPELPVIETIIGFAPGEALSAARQFEQIVEKQL